MVPGHHRGWSQVRLRGADPLPMHLGFIWITDVECLRIEGLNIPDFAAGALPAACAAIDRLSV
ncbi:hypothetical protein AQZ49_20740 [Novosphingobium sp. FSW06-99]|nr:hypothetical protein AQZ49_20740 [Novosphingobium sp. FSW06-99]